MGYKLTKEKKIEIQLIRGFNTDGERVYIYLALYKHRVRDLKLALMTKTTSPEDFGVIIASGEGEPDEETENYIHETYFAKKNN